MCLRLIFYKFISFCVDFKSLLAHYISMIKWDEKYSVGISIIDEEHKELIRIMNEAIAAKQNDDNVDEISKLLKELTAYALKHFLLL